MKTFIYCTNRTILNEKVRGCRALPGQLLSIQLFFPSLESWHLKWYASGLKKRGKKRKIENKRFDPESNTTNLSVDTFKHHDYQLNSFYCICGVLVVLCCFIAGIKRRALIYSNLYPPSSLFQLLVKLFIYIKWDKRFAFQILLKRLIFLPGGFLSSLYCPSNVCSTRQMSLCCICSLVQCPPNANTVPSSHPVLVTILLHSHIVPPAFVILDANLRDLSPHNIS